MYKICFYVPESHLEQVKNAMFEKGAGKIGLYARCSWQTLGLGQALPLEGSDPFIGTTHVLETIEEYKVELVCANDCIKEVIAAMKQSHPYETPAYQVFKVEDF